MFAGVLKNLGTKRAFIVHGADGLDEATVTGETRVSELKEGLINTYNLNPVDFFGEVYDAGALAGGSPAENAVITRNILAGKDGAGRKIVLLNAALAIMAGGKAGNVREGIDLAAECIDNGAALQKLDALIAATRV